MNTQQTAHAIVLTRQLLDDGLQQLPHHITERLRAARVQALRHKTSVVTQKNNGFLTWLQQMPTLAKSLIALPVLASALLIGTHIQMPQNLDTPSAALGNVFAPAALMQTHTTDQINIDAILNEKIPLQAYLNDDFNRFIKQGNHK